MDANTVTIMADVYHNLVHSDVTLDLLKAAGVDNWEGYGEVDWAAVDEEVSKITSA